MRLVESIFLTLLLGSSSVFGQSFDRPVNSIHINDDGVYHAGFLYWDTIQTIFCARPEFVVIGKVESIYQTTQPRRGAEENTWSGRLSVDEVLVCPDSLIEAASMVRAIESDGFGGLAIGDTVLVFMTPYEGAYAIPCWRGSNTNIGHIFNRQKKFVSCDDYEFLRLIRSGRAWNLETLSSTELRLWRCVDPEGLLDAFIREKAILEDLPKAGD